MLQSSPTIIITFSRPQLYIFIVTRRLKVSVIIANILTFLIGAAHITNSSNIHLQKCLQNMLYTAILLSCRKSDFVCKKSIAHSYRVNFCTRYMQIQVAHALRKQGCRLINYTANIRLVTIAACYNCPRSPYAYYCKKNVGSKSNSD